MCRQMGLHQSPRGASHAYEACRRSDRSHRVFHRAEGQAAEDNLVGRSFQTGLLHRGLHAGPSRLGEDQLTKSCALGR